MDLVGTCPKGFWEKWLAEGDCAGDQDSNLYYYWETRSRIAHRIQEGERFYVVAHSRLRGYASVVQVDWDDDDSHHPVHIWRSGGAVAVTIPEAILGFQGVRRRWWDRKSEIPFPNWKTP